MQTLKIGYLVHATVVKALPGYDAYLCLINGSEVLAVLPITSTDKEYLVGDSFVAAVFAFKDGRVVLSQKSPQYLRRIAEFAFAPLLQDGKIQIKRAATVNNAKFSKIAVKGLNGEDPVKLCLKYLPNLQSYIDHRTVTLVRYSDNLEEYVVNALCPAPKAEVQLVVHHKEMSKVEVFVRKASLALFLGKGGANVATAAKLIDVAIEVKPSYTDSRVDTIGEEGFNIHG